MLFYSAQPKKQKIEYEKFLKIAGCLSNLFGDSKIPYLYYRVAEKVFCKSFEADDLSRGDLSVDARKNNIGIGLKTFLIGNSRTYQKIAEFNADRSLYEGLDLGSQIKKIATLRNERINFTENAYGLSNSIYHCILRDKKKFLVFEEPMERIQIENIKNIKKNTGSISFQDGTHDYSFLVSKSTLTKRFITAPVLCKFDIKILDNPLLELGKLLKSGSYELETKSKIQQTIILPLYGEKQTVYPKSALNQWNAGGRQRDLSEVYIPVPATIHRNFRNFFPPRDTPFTLKLPNGQSMRAKICQDGDKALMSYSNKELGQWILRDVLGLKEGELLTNEKLKIVGIDSVRVDKISNTQFEINFCETGSYENFADEYFH